MADTKTVMKSDKFIQSCQQLSMEQTLCPVHDHVWKGKMEKLNWKTKWQKRTTKQLSKEFENIGLPRILHSLLRQYSTRDSKSLSEVQMEN